MHDQRTFPPTDPPSAEQPETVRSEPVPVPPPADAAAPIGTDVDEESREDETREDEARDEAARDAAEDVTDRAPDDALDDRGTFEDPVLAGERTDPDDLTAVTPGTEEEPAGSADEPEFHEPADQPTAFGAATVGGAAAAAALAGPSRVTDRDGRDEEAPADEPVDEARAADEPFAEPETPAEVGEEPVGEAAPEAELLPGEVPAEPVTALWGDDAAQGFRDRWREVQLRFIDDPRGAATEAQILVDEAVESLTAALAAQRTDLGGWAATEPADTEQLRVVVRRYRDFLDRLLGL